MKAYKYIVLCITAVALAGCEDFFSNESPSAMDAHSIFSNAQLTEQAICGIYQPLALNNGYINRLACGYAGLNTDIEWSSKSLNTDGQQDVMLYKQENNNTNISNSGGDAWSYLGTMIERSNNAIEGIRQYGDTTEGSALRYYLGEALFLRSFAYLEMIKLWGDVPARFESLSAKPEGINAKKTDRNIIFEQLRVDLKDAARFMPWSNDAKVPSPAKNNVGRASKAAALALLARADLMYAGKAVRPTTLDDKTGYSVRPNFTDDALRQQIYEEVMWACSEIIKNEDYKLARDFAQPFQQICSDNLNYTEMEHIWVIPYANGARGRVLNYNAPKLSSNALTAVVGHLPGVAQGAKSNGHICVSPYLVYQFEPNDKRRAVTFVPGQWEYNDATDASKNAEDRERMFPGTTASEKKLWMKNVTVNNLYLGKYRFEWMKGRAANSDEDGIDFPILRYADVLLMFAEASIGSNMNVTPVNHTGLIPLNEFNKIRDRAGIDRAEKLDTTIIMVERAKELCGEYVRKYDLMRWGNLKYRMMESEKFIRTIASVEGQKTATLEGVNITVTDTIWYKYVIDPSVNNGYRMDSIYGLAANQSKRPEYFNKANGWIAKNIYCSDSKGYYLGEKQYPMYASAENLESRQHWPIFKHYLDASNGNLWNNYGY